LEREEYEAKDSNSSKEICQPFHGAGEHAIITMCGICREINGETLSFVTAD